MADIPAETVTFLFTDIEQSTALVKRLQALYASALAEHRGVLRAVATEHGGFEVDTEGDAFFLAFARASDAVRAAAEAQRRLAAHAWPEGAAIAARMGLHTGEAYRAEHGYVGVAVHRAARICSLGHGGQILLSRSTAGIVDDSAIAGVAVRELGEHLLKDFPRPERVSQLVVEGLPAEFPPLRALDRQPPLEGTVTVVMVEGRRVMRLHRRLDPEAFALLIGDYQRFLTELLEAAGGHYLEAANDTVSAAFPTAKAAALAAARAQRGVAARDWPHGTRLEVTIGIHSGTAGFGWSGPAILRCAELCDAAEAGQIFVSPATAALLEEEDLGELALRDLGVRTARGSGEPVRASELVVPPPRHVARETDPPTSGA